MTPYEKDDDAEKANGAIALGRDVIEHCQRELKLDDDQMPFLEDGSGRLFLYTGRFWREISEATAKAMAQRRAKHPHKCTDRMRGEAMRYVRAVCHVEDHAWGKVADFEVPCLNGVVDVLTGKMRAHRAADYLESVIPFDYTPGARSATLEAFFSSTFGDQDEQRRAALQFFAGYVVLPHAKFKRALVLQGPPDTGKSQFVLLLKELVGAKFTCSLSVEEMDDPVARSVLVGKRLNVMTELPAEAMIRDGGFKQLVSTGDPIAINPKYALPFMYTSAAKHVFATNSMPTVRDRTEATFNRLYIVPFDRAIPEADQDPDLLDKFRSEMPGILAWAVEGARALIESRGVFPVVDLAKARIERMREEANPVAHFVAQMMVEESFAACPLNEVTTAFNAWHQGRKFDIRAVGRLLRARFGDDAVGAAWCAAIKRNAVSFKHWRLRTSSELAIEDGRADWSTSPPPGEP